MKFMISSLPFGSYVSRWVLAGLLLLVVLAASYVFLYIRWKPIWQPVSQLKAYPVHEMNDDTLRVVMIGDSWTGLHHKLGHDSEFTALLQGLFSQPVKMVARGKGGATSGDIYQMMFRESGLNPEACSQPLIEHRPDYVVITAGINDAAKNLGTDYYCDNYLLILRHLLSCGIRPVVVEMPDVDLAGVYGNKPLKDKVVDRLRSWMTGVAHYSVRPYREALYHRLKGERLMDSLMYVSLNQWHPVFDEVGVHLNAEGYRKLDSCLAVTIFHSRETVDTTLVNSPVNSNTKE